MKVYTYSQARQDLCEVLNRAKTEEVLIRRRGGEVFAVVARKQGGSPFDVPGVKMKAKTSDILAAVRDVRSRKGRQRAAARARPAPPPPRARRCPCLARRARTRPATQM